MPAVTVRVQVSHERETCFNNLYLVIFNPSKPIKKAVITVGISQFL